MRKTQLWIVVLTALLITLNVKSATAPSVPVVSVDPKVNSGLTGTSITVNVNVTNVVNLYSYDVNMTFNPAFLNCTSVTEGPFLGTAGMTWWMEPEIRNDKGYILFGNSLFWMMPPPPPGAGGNGTLATITFDVLIEDGTWLNFSRTELSTLVEEGGTWIPEPIVHDIENGMFTIPGDVNGDRTVDIFDIGTISAHWYPGPPVGPLGYSTRADINKDGSVDIFDIGITSAHWGQSW
ncbi:MAG: cohesin domain-containing protein [Candidatus Bathyarchaeota archaeon]|jgi:hypothetical protein